MYVCAIVFVIEETRFNGHVKYEPMLLRLAEDAVIGDMLSDEGIRTHSEIFDVVPSSRRYSIHSIAFPYRPRTNISYLVV